MKIEFEVKFYINRAEFIDKLQMLGAVQIKPNTLMRRYVFKRFDQQQQVEMQDVRVRDEGDKVTVTYKRFDPSKGIDSVQELEITVDSFDNACLLLENLGLKKARYVENYREIWRLNDCFLMIDLWPALEAIVEIEGENQKSVEKTAVLCGFDMSHGFYGPTARLYEKRFGISRDQYDRIDKLTFDDVPKIFNKC